MKNCNLILSNLIKHKHAWVFNKPVDALAEGLHDYHDIIKLPMDLGTVKSNLAKNLYTSPVDFASDVRLTFHNAMTYNPKGHDIYAMAEQLLARFEELYQPLKKQLEEGPGPERPYKDYRRVLGIMWNPRGLNVKRFRSEQRRNKNPNGFPLRRARQTRLLLLLSHLLPFNHQSVHLPL
ncbi:transcription factor GTE3, chloroplastic-like [Cannabis sativa]|uniref:transcription factor GTE3, chloroplastic-like n=1 Tax=Cannabis sativa TaxID=3483 RepID=UPI0029C9BEDB|nr:transcription factor GTE3, chloroplastic-like [Cannabis sativa]